MITEVWGNGDTIYYKMKNVGDAKIGSLSNPVFIENFLFIDGRKVATDQYVGIINAGQEVKGSFNYRWQPSHTEHVVRVCADGVHAINEKEEENNCREEVWRSSPDLTITSMEYSPSSPRVGGEVTLNVRVANPGNLSSASCKGALLIGKTLYALKELPEIFPHESVEVRLTWIPAVDGLQRLNFYADYGKTVNELNELNNQFAIKVEVLPGIPKKPDLKVLGIAWMPEITTAGEEVKLKLMVQNIGGSPSPPCIGELKVNGVTNISAA